MAQLLSYAPKENDDLQLFPGSLIQVKNPVSSPEGDRLLFLPEGTTAQSHNWLSSTI